jgi:3-hydroxyisobutyrate dehydrogenase-like beta-hydroxyacid dehydrogenase
MGATSAIDTRRIGWIGLGKTGLPVCERLAAQGFEVATLTRNPEGRERATRARLQNESKIAGVVATADIVVSAVSDDAPPLDIVFHAGRLKETLHASQIFVEISTVSPSASQRVAEAMSAIGVRYIRSPAARLRVGGSLGHGS